MTRRPMPPRPKKLVRPTPAQTAYVAKTTYDKVLRSSDEQGWMTPPEIIDPIHDEFGIDLDTCASVSNIHERFYTAEDDGLLQPWDSYFGASVSAAWCNPPFRNMGRWVAKAHQEGDKVVSIVLMNSNTEAAYWRQHVLPAAEIRFIIGRITYIDPQTGEPRRDEKGRPMSSPKGSAIVIWKPGHVGSPEVTWRLPDQTIVARAA